MSAAARILSGTVGSLALVALGFIQRLLIIPIILTYWDTESFGRYLVMSSSLNFVGLLGTSFQAILGREILRVNKLRPDDLVRLYGGGILVSIALEVMVVGVCLGVFILLKNHWKFLHLDNVDVYILAATYFIGRAIIAFPGAAYCALLSCYGYYPKINWLIVLARCFTIVGPVIAIILGFRVSVVVLVEILFPGVLAPISWMLFRRWGLANDIWKWNPNIGAAFKIFLKSLQNVVIQGVELIRGEGVRLLIGPLSGTSALAAFTTMRTGANVALQGLGTITSPLMPELMRFLSQRDQPRIEAAFSTVWLVVVGMMAPAVIVLQLVAPHLFVSWTRGHIVFDPMLFATFSLSVLVYASAQPAMAVLQGNNILRPQLLLSTLTGGTAVLGVFVLVPHFGIRGAAAALLAAEVLAATGYRIMASSWLRENGLAWPVSASNYVFTAVFISGVGMGSVVLWPRIGVFDVILCLVLQFLCLTAYWRQLPDFARRRVVGLVVGRLPVPLGRLVGRVLA